MKISENADRLAHFISSEFIRLPTAVNNENIPFMIVY